MFNHDLSMNDLERNYLAGIHKSAYPCLKCGGVSHLTSNDERICSYCGEPIEEYHSIIQKTDRRLIAKIYETGKIWKRALQMPALRR